MALNFKSSAIILGVAFLLSGLIQYMMRRTLDADLIVGVVIW